MSWWLAVGLAPGAFAQGPPGTRFTYQGRLSDGGAPASGPFDFRFILYDAALGGSQVGPTEERDDVPVANGLFTVVLDFGPVFTGNGRFLDVAVRPGASTGAFISLTPRHELTSAPTAQFSAAAPWSGVSGKPAGFADDVDDDSGGTVTSVAAGPGLVGGPITTTGSLAVAFGGPGVATTAARSDHLHDDAYVRNSSAQQPGVNFNIGGTGTAAVFAASTQFNLGAARILANPGTNNLFAGVGAGASQTTGSANTYFGASAGGANAAGGSNSFFGFNSGRSTTGSNNSFFGDAAGFSNTTGGSAFFGFLAGFSNTTGAANSFFGRQAGRSNTTGNGNSFFGDNAGFSSTSINNSFFGRNAGISNTVGSVNSFFGEGAGANNTTGGGNVFVGREAAFQNVTGSRNIVIGSGTGFGNTSGSDLTVVGTFANVGADGLSFATALGAGAIVAASNTVVLGRAADTVQAPGALTVGGPLSAGVVNATGLVSASAFDAAGQFSQAGERVLAGAGNQNLFVGRSSGPEITTGSFNTFVGSGAGFSTTEGNANTFVGQGAGFGNTNGSNNTFIGKSSGASAPVSNSVAIGSGVQVSTSNTVLLGTGVHTTLIPGLLRAGDGGGGNFSLQVVTSAIGGGVVGRNLYITQLNQSGSPSHLCWKVAPDGVQALLVTTCTTPFAGVRHKTDLQSFAGGLDIVGRLQPMSFTWKEGGTRDIGLTPEDVATVEPLLVRWNDEGGGEDVKPEPLIAVLVSAIQEQQSQLEALREQMRRQEEQAHALLRLVCAGHTANSLCSVNDR